jgi:enterochelin esterase-like enzyme
MMNWPSFDAFLRDALNTSIESRQALVDGLLRQRANFPWVEGDKATFIYARPGAQRVAVNLDTIRRDPPFVQMENLAGTTLWYVTVTFHSDDLLDYMIVVDDPMTPVTGDRNIVARVNRYWHIDPYNPTRITTPQMSVSVLRMSKARPFPDWSKLQRVQSGRVDEYPVKSVQLNFSGRKCWIYTPPGYESGYEPLPLMILLDGEWMNGPLQANNIADALIKHNAMQPAIFAMMQSGDQSTRDKAFTANDRHYQFLISELLPFVQTEYRVDPSNIGIGGVGMGAVAAAHAALKNPAVFSRVILLSPPLGDGKSADELKQVVRRFDDAENLPKRIFQSVGRYEGGARFKHPARELRDTLNRRGSETAYRYCEVGSGHSLVAFRSILPEALAWVLPPVQEQD